MSSARESLGWEGDEDEGGGGLGRGRGGGRRVERSLGSLGFEREEVFRENNILKMEGMAVFQVAQEEEEILVVVERRNPEREVAER